MDISMADHVTFTRSDANLWMKAFIFDMSRSSYVNTILILFF